MSLTLLSAGNYTADEVFAPAPGTPCLILTGTPKAVAAAAKLLGTAVVVAPAPKPPAPPPPPPPPPRALKVDGHANLVPFRNGSLNAMNTHGEDIQADVYEVRGGWRWAAGVTDADDAVVSSGALSAPTEEAAEVAAVAWLTGELRSRTRERARLGREDGWHG